MKPYALILANDHIDPTPMLGAIEETRDYIDAVKVGITSTMAPGIRIIEKARRLLGDDKELIVDFKVADIGFKNKDGIWQGTNEKIVRTLCEAGADLITAHTIVGSSSIEECIQTAHHYDSEILTLPFMTHRGAELFFGMPLGKKQREHIWNVLKKVYDRNIANAFFECPEQETIIDVILSLGELFGVDGYIGPGNNPEVLKRYREFTDRLVCCPGFGRQDKLGRSLEEQIEAWAQIMGPNSGMIVGSLIYKAKDPGRAAREVMETRDRVVSRL